MKAVQWIGISLVSVALVACGSEEAPKTKSAQSQPAAATSTVAVKKAEMPANHEQIKQALAKARQGDQMEAGALGKQLTAEVPATQQSVAAPAKKTAEANPAVVKEAAKAAVVKETSTVAKAGVASEAPKKAVVQKVAIATGDAVKGKALARKCLTCHNLNERKKVGPGLKGVVGRKAGQMTDMKYSSALRQGGWVWDEANLAAWICDSKKAVKILSGDASATTKMPAQRICDARKQADLIAFLKTL